MSDARHEPDDELLDTAADRARDILTEGGKNLTVSVGQYVARRLLVGSVSKNYPQELARQILANPGDSSSSLFLKTINALAGNAQDTARFANKIAPILGKYFAVVVDPTITWIKMTRDGHTPEEIARAVKKSLALGMIKTSASAVLGPVGGTAAGMGVDLVARRLDEQ